MNKTGELFYIKVYFWSLKEQLYRDCWLAVDTGASVTALSRNALMFLGYNLSGDGPLEKIRTASGIEFVPKIILGKMRFGGCELENIEAHAIDFPDIFLIGVIGLNILTKFDINFLFSKNILEFTPIDEEAVSFA